MAPGCMDRHGLRPRDDGHVFRTQCVY